jgi:hypothetical protein
VLRVRIALVDVAHVLAMKQRSFRPDMNEATYAAVACDLQQLTRPFDVSVPELLARTPLLHERSTVDDDFAAGNRLRGDGTELAADWCRPQCADGRIAAFRSR